MKNNFLVTVLVAFSLVFFAQCSETDDNDNNNNNNWAGVVAGTYTGTGQIDDSNSNNNNGPATTTIARTADNSLNVQITYDGYSLCLDSVLMNSPTTFNISEYDGCEQESVTGGGSFNGDNVNYTLCCISQGHYGITVTGTK